MSELTFYTNPMSRGRIVRWMLEETGAPYETKFIEYGPEMKSPEYLAINPMGKVPVLKHGDTVITECAAICTYLADAFPEANLAPTPTSPLRGTYYRWLFYTAGPIEAAVNNKSMGLEIPEDKQATTGYGSFEIVMSTLKTALKDKQYLVGDNFTTADLYLGAHVGWGIQFDLMDKDQIFIDYVNRLQARPAYLKAKAMDDEAMGES